MSSRQVHTKFSHLTDDEITQLVSSCECTQLEVELAARLREVLDEVREITDSMHCLPPLTYQDNRFTPNLLADCE